MNLEQAISNFHPVVTDELMILRVRITNNTGSYCQVFTIKKFKSVESIKAEVRKLYNSKVEFKEHVKEVEVTIEFEAANLPPFMLDEIQNK